MGELSKGFNMTLKQENEELKKVVEKWQNNRQLWDDMKFYEFLSNNLKIQLDRKHESDGTRLEINLVLTNPVDGKPNIISNDSFFIYS